MLTQNAVLLPLTQMFSVSWLFPPSHIHRVALSAGLGAAAPGRKQWKVRGVQTSQTLLPSEKMSVDLFLSCSY